MGERSRTRPCEVPLSPLFETASSVVQPQRAKKVPKASGAPGGEEAAVQEAILLKTEQLPKAKLPCNTVTFREKARKVPHQAEAQGIHQRHPEPVQGRGVRRPHAGVRSRWRQTTRGRATHTTLLRLIDSDL